jgi:hypothetical protein
VLFALRRSSGQTAWHALVDVSVAATGGEKSTAAARVDDATVVAAVDCAADIAAHVHHQHRKRDDASQQQLHLLGNKSIFASNLVLFFVRSPASCIGIAYAPRRDPWTVQLTRRRVPFVCRA